MEVPEVHPLNFALRYSPSTLVMHYYIGNDTSQEFVHQVNLSIEKNTTADKIVNELISKESVYFDPKIVPPEQLKRLVQKLIDNKGKKIGREKLRASNIGKTQVESIPLQKHPEDQTDTRGKKKPEIPSLTGKLPGSSDLPKQEKVQYFEDLKPKGKQEVKKETGKEFKMENDAMLKLDNEIEGKVDE